MTFPLDRIRRLALIRLSALGDVVNTLPALTALRRALPQAHLTWVVEAASANLLHGHPLLDDLIVVHRKRWVTALRRGYGLLTVPRELWALARSLQRPHFDAALDFQGNLRSGVVTFHTRAPFRVGFAAQVAKERSHLFTNYRVALPVGPMHRVERALRLVAALGIETADAAPHVLVADEDRQQVEKCLADADLLEAPFAVIHAGTSAFGRTKQWTPEGWRAVAEYLAREHDLVTVFTHGPSAAETREAEALAEKTAGLAAPLFSLRELGELFRRCRLFLSPDTGPMHLASAVGAPVVALFGPKDPAIYGPYFGPRAIVEKSLPCRPCPKRACDDPRCMLTITPHEVIAAAERLLEETRGKRDA
jgi:lipopolysaccharide heptosyltransferase I